MRAGVAGALVEPQAGDCAGDVGAELDAELDADGVGVGGVPGVAPSSSRAARAATAAPTVTVTGAGGARCSRCRRWRGTLIVAGPGRRRRPGVRPGAAPGGRVPGAAAVGGDLDPADHAAAGVGRGAADGHGARRPARIAPAAGAVIRDVGAAVSVDVVATVSPDCSVAGCAPMSASRLTVACCIGVPAAPDPRSWLRRAPRTTGPCRRRRPAPRWPPGRGSGGGSRCRCRTSSRSPAAPGRHVDVVVDRSIRPAGREPLSRSSSHS